MDARGRGILGWNGTGPRARVLGLVGGLVAGLGVTLLAGPAGAQQVGGPVPPFEGRPVQDAPVRETGMMAPRGAGAWSDPGTVFGGGYAAGPDAATAPGPAGAGGGDGVGRFRRAYQAKGRPRLALYWNHQLSESLNEWYGSERMVMRESAHETVSGSAGYRADGMHETIYEPQTRMGPPGGGRLQPSETWEWEFQDGLLAPLLDAGAVVVDRVAINRFTAARTGGSTGPGGAVEAQALQGMADYMIEILLAGSAQSTVGYELRARVLDTRTGQIVTSASSRTMEGWGPPQARYVAGPFGFADVSALNQDGRIGPTGETTRRWEAGADGFSRRTTPPRPAQIAGQLSVNVMNALATAWSGGGRR